MKAGVVLAFPHLEFMPHFQSHPSHTWLILASPLGLKKPGTRKPLRTPGLGRALGLGVDTTCSLLHLGAACALLSASQRPGRRLFWVNLGQRREKVPQKEHQQLSCTPMITSQAGMISFTAEKKAIE